MRVYVFKAFRRVKRVVAEERMGYLVWPGTRIPFVDRDVLAQHPEKDRIEAAIDAADEKALWNDKAILSMTLKVAESLPLEAEG